MWILVLTSLAFGGIADQDGDTVPDAIESTLGDTDGDGTPNINDPDDDGDGIPTAQENWSQIALCTEPSVGTGVRSTDSDGDTVPDYLDDDDDDDGVPTLYEALASTDALCPDSDLDGVSDADEWCAHPCVHPLSDAQYRAPRSTDSDGVIDALDEDDDGDGVLTFFEGDGDVDSIPIGANGPLTGSCTNDEIIRCDPQPDGIPNYLDLNSDGDCVADGAETSDSDEDNDGVPDMFDCTSNACGDDADGDGLDNCDELNIYLSDPFALDTDNDGVPDDIEAGSASSPTHTSGTTCLHEQTNGQQPCYDIRNPDDDGDGVPTRVELCMVPPSPETGDCEDVDRFVFQSGQTTEPPNTDDVQTTTDDGRSIVTDSIPDYLDDDDDGDRLPTAEEDADGDGDPTTDDADEDGRPDYLDVLSDGPCGDLDGDGIDNAIESYLGLDPTDAEADTDGDGISDADEAGDELLAFLDSATERYCLDPGLDSEPDGLVDLDGLLLDSDGDGIPDVLDEDDDNDGIPTATEYENSSLPNVADNDTDGDGTPDHLDLDSDDDGFPDADEGSGDDNGDGVPNYLEAYEGQPTQEPQDAPQTCGCSSSGAPIGLVLLWPLLALRRRPTPE